MRKKKQKNDDFFIETIDLTPSNNIQTSYPQDYQNIPMPNIDNGSYERISDKRFGIKLGRKIKNNLLKIFLFTMCLYMVFLIIGALKTTYYVDSETGIRKPVFVTYNDVATKEDYFTMQKELDNLRELLVKIRITEIKYVNGDIDAYTAANQYKDYLTDVDVAIPKLSAANVMAPQENIKTAMSSCYTTYLAGYLQEMYKALTKNDVAAENTAVQHRKLMLQTYSDAEKSLKAVADKLKIQDDYFNWDLDEAAKQKDPTAVLKSK